MGDRANIVIQQKLEGKHNRNDFLDKLYHFTNRYLLLLGVILAVVIVLTACAPVQPGCEWPTLCSLDGVPYGARQPTVTQTCIRVPAPVPTVQCQ
jgi:hypothetical protein